MAVGGRPGRTWSRFIAAALPIGNDYALTLFNVVRSMRGFET
jgi:hypothetical protein